MTDIFLSYSSEDRDRVVPLVEALQADGFEVWWDRDIRPGPSFDREIEAALDQAGCVVVVWSTQSVESEWVRSEVEEGARLGILVPLLIDDVLPPLAYRRRQSANLSGWTGDRRHAEYRNLLSGIAATLESPGERARPVKGARTRSGAGHRVGKRPYRGPRHRHWPATAVVAAVSMALGWLLAGLADRGASGPTPQASVQRTVIDLPDGQMLALADLAPLGVGRRSLEFSPDGTYLAYVADIGGRSQLFLRPMDAFDVEPLAGTEGAFFPFFSPDGQWLGYLTRTHIMKIAVNGGTPQIMAEASNVVGAHWGDDGRIVFADREGSSLVLISSQGTDRTELPKPGGEWTMNPRFLPGGKALLATAADSSGGLAIKLLNLETGDWRTVLENSSAARYLPTGHLLYSGIDMVMAAPFDLQTHQLRSTGTPVLTGVRHESDGAPQLTVSDKGWLAYLPGPDTRISTPVWRNRVDRGEIPIPMPRDRYGTFSLSPDDQRLAILVMGATSDVWLYDFERATPALRFTTGGYKTGVQWDGDGRHLVFAMAGAAGQESSWGIYRQALNGSLPEPVLPFPSRFVNVTAVGEDGTIVFSFLNDSNEDLMSMNPGDSPNTRTLADTPANEWGGTRSPDGHYVAYTSDEAGEYQIYVKRFPPDDQRWMISAGYGEEPIWSRRGDEIFYRRGHQWLSVPVKTTPDFEAGIPDVIFEGSYLNAPGHSYDVASDAQRFLVLKMGEQPAATRIRVVSNWFHELERLAPSPP